MAVLASCSPTPVATSLSAPASAVSALYVFRFSPAALLEFSADLASVQSELPLRLPADCSLWSLHPAPLGSYVAAELACAGGPAVLLLDLEARSVTVPVDEAVDSHFLAWEASGEALYLRVDSLGEARIVRVELSSGRTQRLNIISPFTYDLSPAPDGERFTYTFTRGLGSGSEVWLAEGRSQSLLLAAPQDIIAFVRWSPDGERLAYIRMPDSQTPFSVGELWLMNADGSEARLVAAADAGRGYAPAWSPDGTRLAFVARQNPQDARANQSAAALLSNIYFADVTSRELTPVTEFPAAWVEAPFWSPEGRFLTFNVVMNGTMNVWAYNLNDGSLSPLTTDAGVCCPAWVQK